MQSVGERARQFGASKGAADDDRIMDFTSIPHSKLIETVSRPVHVRYRVNVDPFGVSQIDRCLIR